MNTLKIKLYITILPQNESIPCKNMEYAVVPVGKKPEDYLWDNTVNIDKSKLENWNNPRYLNASNGNGNIGFNLQKQNELKNLQLKFKEFEFKNNRKSKTDNDGFTKEMYLPEGAYDVWIKRSDSAWELAYFNNGSRGIKVKTGNKLFYYQIRQYYRYKISNFNGKPMENIPFETYTYDKNNKEVKIAIKNLNSKKSDKNGLTPLLYSPNGHLVYVKFKFLNMDVFPEKKDIKHYATVSKNNFVEVKLKSVASISQDDKSTTVNLQGTGKPPVILNALKEEMIVLSKEDYEEFEKESAKLDHIFGNAKEARRKLEEAIKSGSVNSIKLAEDEISKAEKTIEEELNKNFKKQADLTEVITFEARQKRNPNGNTQEFDLRRRYLRTDRYMQLQQRKKNKESFKVTALGKELKNLKDLKQINKDVVKEEFKKVSKELAAYSKSTGTKVWDFTPFSGAFVEQVKLSDNLTLDTQSQWLRCVGGAGVSSSINWKPGTNEFGVKAGANAQGKLVLFEGKMKLTRCLPTEKGWMLNFDNIDLGAFRFILTSELYGFTGAKVAAGIGVEISHSKEGQRLASSGRRNRNPSLANNTNQGRPRFVPMKNDETMIPGSGGSGEGQIEVFAGAEAGVKSSIEFQWLSPEVKDFSSLATLAPDLAVSAGIGAGASFLLYYWDGQFRIRAKAALCVGVGAKGALDFTIDYKKFFEMGEWIFYQLIRAGFRTLMFISEDAFTRFSRVSALALGEEHLLTKALTNTTVALREFNSKYALAEKSKELALKIMKQENWLKFAPPEAKGMLIYQMTRHGIPTHVADLPKYGIGPFLPTFKSAIIAIFETVSTEGEWLNILQRINLEGKKSSKDIRFVEQELLGFLHDGLWSRKLDFVKEYVLNKEIGRGSEYVEKYEIMRSKVVKTIPLHEKAPLNNPRELKRLREKMVEQPSIINEDSLSAASFEPVQPLAIDNSEADIFLANAYEANSNDSKLA